MKMRGLERLAPLSGVVFVLLIVIGAIVGGETPDTKDSQQSIVQFWTENDAARILSDAIGAWAVVFFMWFAATLRSVLRAAETGPARLASLSLAGATIAATGLLCVLSIDFATAESAGDVPGEVTHTLTVLNNNFFFPMAAGYGIFLLAAGVLAVRTGVLPAWLGWAAIVIGVLCLTPVGFFAILVGLVWTLAASVVLYQRASRQPAASAT
jgi:hypothetical protein